MTTNLHTCCDFAIHSDGACVAQANPCPESTEFAIDLGNLSADQYMADVPVPQDFFGVSFPSGINGYMTWETYPTVPWVGVCLLSSIDDPVPVGCLSVSLSPGIGAATIRVQIPMSDQWTAYTTCYGAPPCSDTSIENPKGGVNDINDPTVTDIGGSCCRYAMPLLVSDLSPDSNSEWNLVMGEAIPGVPPPLVIIGDDNQVHANCDHYTNNNPSAAIVNYCGADEWEQVSVPDTCLALYNESPNCGSKPSRFQSQLEPAFPHQTPTTYTTEIGCNMSIGHTDLMWPVFSLSLAVLILVNRISRRKIR